MNQSKIDNNTNASNLLPHPKSSSLAIVPKTESNDQSNSEFPVNSNSNASGDLSQVNFSSSGQKKSVEEKSSSDRYAALKDLDDMFKSTVLSEGNLIQQYFSYEILLNLGMSYSFLHY